MSQLQHLAKLIRQYRLYLRNGILPAESLDHPNFYESAALLQAPPEDVDQKAQQDFLTFYREQLVQCLDQAIQQVLGDRLNHLHKKTPEKVQQFLHALHLFHCEGYSMGEIAPQVGLQAQFQVTRLMKLKELRASIQSVLLQLLLARVIKRAQNYLDPPHLEQLHDSIQSALTEEISTLIQQSETEASTVKRRPLTSLFAQRICHYLDTRSVAL